MLLIGVVVLLGAATHILAHTPRELHKEGSDGGTDDKPLDLEANADFLSTTVLLQPDSEAGSFSSEPNWNTWMNGVNEELSNDLGDEVLSLDSWMGDKDDEALAFPMDEDEGWTEEPSDACQEHRPHAVSSWSAQNHFPSCDAPSASFGHHPSLLAWRPALHLHQSLSLVALIRGCPAAVLSLG